MVVQMIAFLTGAAVSGLMFGTTNRLVFFLPAALMALLVASVLIVLAERDVTFTALTASVFCSGYLLGVVIANTRPLSHGNKARRIAVNIAKLPTLVRGRISGSSMLGE
jgi:hypothetical protein